MQVIFESVFTHKRNANKSMLYFLSYWEKIYKPGT